MTGCTEKFMGKARTVGMKTFLDVLTNIRIGVMEICGTVGVMFLLGYGTYKAYVDFVAPLIK